MTHRSIRSRQGACLVLVSLLSLSFGLSGPAQAFGPSSPAKAEVAGTDVRSAAGEPASAAERRASALAASPAVKAQLVRGAARATAAATCRQHTQAWEVVFGYGVLHSDFPGGSLRVPPSTTVYYTGIVVPNSRILFRHVSRLTGRVVDIYTVYAGGNCVIPHERTSQFAYNWAADGGLWDVTAAYVAWESFTVRATYLGSFGLAA